MENYNIIIAVEGGGGIRTTEADAPAILPAGRHEGVLEAEVGVWVPAVFFTRPTYLMAQTHSPACTTEDGLRNCTCL